jgi:arginine utilization protein RocB
MAEGWDRFKKEVGQMLDQKVAQGAAEVSQALNSQADAYVPYGAAQRPLEVEGPAVSYQEMLREASQREAPEQDLGMDR